jgi:hypothetical protein
MPGTTLAARASSSCGRPNTPEEMVLIGLVFLSLLLLPLVAYFRTRGEDTERAVRVAYVAGGVGFFWVFCVALYALVQGALGILTKN